MFARTKQGSPSFKEELKKLETLPMYKPFGDTEVDTVSAKDLKKKKKSREVILFPEKTNLDAPKKSKLKTATKEISSMQDKLTNIVRVPTEQLDTFMNSYNMSSSRVSKEFLGTIAPAFLAFEDAMNYSTVALRDGLSYDGEIDLEILPLLEWATRLNTFEVFLENLTSLSITTKKRILRVATIKAIEKAFTTKTSSSMLYGANNNKVAGIVTSLDEERQVKVKQAMDSVSKLKKLSDGVKNNSSGIGTLLKKRRKG
jgi:hypothetical protein